MKVYLDMDGVLCDFNKPACAIVDYSYPPTYWDWVDEIPGNRQKINKQCTQTFWQNLKWKSDGKEILSVVLDNFPQNQIYLLTAPMSNSGSWTGKFLWVKKQLPLFMKQIIITPAPKSLLAGPNTLLIDDKGENVKEFRAAGGQAILVPRAWNCNYDCQRLSCDYVAHKLEEVVFVNE